MIQDTKQDTKQDIADLLEEIANNTKNLFEETIEETAKSIFNGYENERRKNEEKRKIAEFGSADFDYNDKGEVVDEDGNPVLVERLGGRARVMGNLQESLDEILDMQNTALAGGAGLAQYPVGAIYMSTSSTSPSELFGGEWEPLKDRFLVGAGGTYSGEGGSADAVLVKHTHDVTFVPSGSGGIAADGTTLQRGSMGTWGDAANASQATSTQQLTLASMGEDGTNKNLPPYLAVYMWKRTG